LVGEERAAAASLRKIMEGAVGPKVDAPMKSKTPFYSREQD
jgi:hypothetical protein